MRYTIKGRTHRLKDVMAYMPFVYYYIGPTALVTYFMAGRALLGRASYRGLFFGLSFTVYVLFLFFGNGFTDGLYVVRFFWGFLLFYLIFKSGIQIQVDRVLLFLSVLTLLEAVLVNTVIPAESLPNYPSIDAYGHFAEMGGYQRPYSFGGSASVTSVILVALLAVSKLGWRGKSLVIAAISACMSGSGFLALFIYLLAIAPPIWLLLLVPMLIGIVYSGIITKISVEYISFLLDFKMGQIMNEVPMDSLLIGVPLGKGVDGMGGDYALLSFFVFNGFVGLLFLLTVILLNINKRNWLPLLIMLVGTVHYGAIFFLPGQLMFGYFLNLKSEFTPANVPNQKECS